MTPAVLNQGEERAQWELHCIISSGGDPGSGTLGGVECGTVGAVEAH